MLVRGDIMFLNEDYYAQPPTHERITEGVFSLAENYPEHCKVFTVGQSVLGKEIYGVLLGKAQGATLFVGGTHGGEWLTTLLLLYFLDDLLNSISQNLVFADINIKKTLQTRGLIIVPALNPDGIEIALHEAKNTCNKNHPLWQANAHGVDINHNFNAGWKKLHRMEQAAGIVRGSPSQYGGPHAESEPETKAICKLCTSLNLRQAYSFHSQGEEIYYKYGAHTPPRSRLMAELLADTSGYKPIAQGGLASHGGLKDWFIETLHRPAFTIEIGKGTNPLPISQLIPIYTTLKETLALAVIL